MKKKVLIAVGLLLVVGLALVDYMGTRVGGGWFDLPITVLANGKVLGTSEVRRVATDFGRATEWSRWPPSRDDERLGMLDETQFDGRSFVASLPCPWSESGLGLRSWRGQPRKLYVRIELSDGRVLRCVCPVADREHDPEIVVDIGEIAAPILPTTAPDSR